MHSYMGNLRANAKSVSQFSSHWWAQARDESVKPLSTDQALIALDDPGKASSNFTILLASLAFLGELSNGTKVCWKASLHRLRVSFDDIVHTHER